jgi:2-octaprenyl-6-methoxyphenol hydroxylase
MNPAPDVLIAGAGPVGLALAVALSDADLSVLLVDARARDAGIHDPRILALSHGSRQLLEQLGVWQQLDATPITTIHVSQQGGLGRTLLQASDYGLPALGYVASAGRLTSALLAAVDACGMTLLEHTRVQPTGEEAQPEVLLDTATGADVGKRACRPRLVAWCEGVIADDGGDEVRRRDYCQHALITLATPQQAHGGLAFERFTPHGPVALLPFGRNYSVVYTTTPDQAEALRTLPEAAFMAQLEEELGGRVRFAAVGPRHVFPLGLKVRAERARRNAVWLGNAAQTLHPVAGQGFNLALRDVFELADRIRREGLDHVPALLARYGASRRLDRAGTVGFTDTLVRLFSNDNPLLRHLRGAGLLALDLIPPARHFVARRMMFGARAWP